MPAASCRRLFRPSLTLTVLGELNPKSWTILEVSYMNKKYSTEFKFKVVQEYQKGEKGSHILGHEMNIHPSMVLSWYHLYKQHGIDGLRTRRTASPYSEEFKEKVQLELRNKAPINFLRAKYHLSPSTLQRWRLECGMAKKSVTRIITREELNALQEKHKGTKDSEIKELLEQLEYAKMENDILKKLATLVQARKEKERRQSEN